MVGVLLATHGCLAKSFIDSVELIIGQKKLIDCVCLSQGDDIQEFSNKIKQKIKEVDEGEGVIVFTDLFGGSPANIMIQIINDINYQHKVYCITGLNVPMLVNLLMLREEKNISLENLYEQSYKAGVSGIYKVNDFFKLKEV
jgi:PTS system mannose-specific IIA component